MEADAAWKVACDSCPPCAAGSSGEDIDAHFAALEKLISAYHSARLGRDLSLTDRGGEVLLTRREARQHEGSAETAATHRLGRRFRRLSELLKLWPPVGPCSWNAVCLHAAALRAEPVRTPWRRALAQCRSRSAVEAATAAAEQEYRAARATDWAVRRSRWGKWCRECLSARDGKAGKIWRWIREGSRPVTLPTAVHGPDAPRHRTRKPGGPPCPHSQ